MSDLRDRIEHRLEGLAEFLCRRRWPALIAVAATVAVFASGLPHLTIDMSNEGFLHRDDPILQRYDAFKELFGRDDIIIIAIEPRRLFSRKALGRIKALHEELADKVPHLNDVVSLVNARNTYGDGDRMVVEDLLKRMPRTPAEMAALKARIMANPLFRNQLISQDARLTTIVIRIDAYSRNGDGGDALAGFDDSGAPAPKKTPLTDTENREVVEAVEAILKKHEDEGFRLYMAGTPTVVESIKRASLADMKLFMVLTIVVIGSCLFVMFRRPVGVILPILVVVLTLVCALGLMGHLGVPINTATVILPSFLLSVGVGASVHVLSIFFQHLQRCGDRREAIVHALGHSGLAVIMTCLTTAAGFGSFAAAEVASIAQLGAFSSFGVLLSMAFTVVLLPALLAIIPVEPHDRTAAAGSPIIDRLLDRVTDFSTGNARAIVIVSVVLIAVFLASASQLRFSHNVLTWLPSDWPVRQATEKIDRELRGSVVLEMIVDTGRENGLYDRDILIKLDGLARELESMERGGLFVGKATSVADMVKEIHQALNGNDPASRAIPANPKLIPQEFLLFGSSGSDDLQEVVDTQFRMARFTIRMPWRDTLEYAPFVTEIEQRFRAALGPGVGITTTGVISLFSQTLNAAIRSAANSYAIAFGVITVMMILLIGNLKLGLASMLPNLAPIIVTVGFMWLVDLPLNMFTMLVGSVAIGLAVDDTIHFMHNFRRYFARTGDVQAAVRRTLHTAGRAMLVTSFVLATGFYILLLATMNNEIHFGLLTGTAIVLALLSDFILAPALMVVLNPAPHGQPIDAPIMEGQG